MSEQNSKPRPGIAAVLSFVFNGLGQLYNGQIRKGLLIIFLSSISLLVFIIGSILIGFWLLGKIVFGKEMILGFILFTCGIISICVLGLYSIIDAHQVAAKR